jgi:hypothetical protein
VKKLLPIFVALMLSTGAYAAGAANDPVDGTGLENNPNATYDPNPLFEFICSYVSPAGDDNGNSLLAQIFNASLGGNGDEGFSIAFGVTWFCDPEDPSVGISSEEVDSDPVGQETHQPSSDSDRGAPPK